MATVGLVDRWELMPVFVEDDGSKKETRTAAHIRTLRKEDIPVVGEVLKLKSGGHALTAGSRMDTFVKYYAIKIKDTPILAKLFKVSQDDSEGSIVAAIGNPIFAFTLDGDSPLSYKKSVIFAACIREGKTNFLPITDKLCEHSVCPDLGKAQKIFNKALADGEGSGGESQDHVPPEARNGQMTSTEGPALSGDQRNLLAAIGGIFDDKMGSTECRLKNEVGRVSVEFDKKLSKLHQQIDSEMGKMVDSRIQKLQDCQQRLETQIQSLTNERMPTTTSQGACPILSPLSPVSPPIKNSGILSSEVNDELVKSVCRRLPAGLNPASRNLELIKRVLNRDRTVRLKDFINRPELDWEEEQVFSVHSDGSLRIGKANRSPFSSFGKLREAINNFMMILVESGKVTNADSQCYIARMELLHRNGRAGPQDLATLHQDFTARLIDMESYDYNQDPTTIAILVSRLPQQGGGRGRMGSAPGLHSFSGKCYNCGISGHMARDCRKSRPAKEKGKEEGAKASGFQLGP